MAKIVAFPLAIIMSLLSSFSLVKKKSPLPKSGIQTTHMFLFTDLWVGAAMIFIMTFSLIGEPSAVISLTN